MWAPSKVIVFFGKTFSIRFLLGVISLGVVFLLPERDMGCVSCAASSEFSVHLFLTCLAVFSDWYQISRWLGWEFVNPLGLAQHFTTRKINFREGEGRELG